MTEAPRHPSFFQDRPLGVLEVCRYGLAMIAVAAAFMAIAVTLGRDRPSSEASEVDSAIMINLPPSEASSRAPSDAEDGPEQAAAQAQVARQAPEVQPSLKPVDIAKPNEDVKPTNESPPPAPHPAVALPNKPAYAPPPKPVAVPTTAPRVNHAPAGSDVPVNNAASQGDEAHPHASAHVITVWQRSLMRRLEAAKRGLLHQVRSAGIVLISFEIDRTGHLSSVYVTTGSGSAALDDAAVALVRRAAPFPAPPTGASPHDMSFAVPIRFTH